MCQSAYLWLWALIDPISMAIQVFKNFLVHAFNDIELQKIEDENAKIIKY